ncbi:hypothetical protein HMPREF1862_01185 [Varibaculum cambriense]|uniref:Uncharacterized protein n=1 Tax=Varibaculum cambriense TaxID=184870 RepID=A0AB34WZ53_9ACTO|nr:hypothetical protein HMPREF1862_01185 [Varibaculum cambriense]
MRCYRTGVEKDARGGLSRAKQGSPGSPEYFFYPSSSHALSA